MVCVVASVTVSPPPFRHCCPCPHPHSCCLRLALRYATAPASAPGGRALYLVYALMEMGDLAGHLTAPEPRAVTDRGLFEWERVKVGEGHTPHAVRTAPLAQPALLKALGGFRGALPLYHGNVSLACVAPLRQSFVCCPVWFVPRFLCSECVTRVVTPHMHSRFVMLGLQPATAPSPSYTQNNNNSLTLFQCMRGASRCVPPGIRRASMCATAYASATRAVAGCLTA